MDTDEDIYHAKPQTRGKIAHNSIDTKTASTKQSDLISLSVCSNKLGVYGKIDIYHKDKTQLIERKYQLKQIFKGQIYQLWLQYFCMIEMGYSVSSLAFYEISTNKLIPIDLPGDYEYQEIKDFIEAYKCFNPSQQIHINVNKCAHCVYCNLCDKTDTDNVYS